MKISVVGWYCVTKYLILYFNGGLPCDSNQYFGMGDLFSQYFTFRLCCETDYQIQSQFLNRNYFTIVAFLSHSNDVLMHVYILISFSRYSDILPGHLQVETCQDFSRSPSIDLRLASYHYLILFGFFYMLP